MNPYGVRDAEPRLPFALPARPFSRDVPAPPGDKGHDPLLESLLVHPGIRTPLVAADGTAFSFGLELEFTPTRNPNVLLDYRPFDETEDEWLRRPWEDRVRHVVEWKQRMFPVAKERPVYLERMSHCSLELPERLTMEPNGVFEMRTPPLASLLEMASFLRGTLRSYGPAQLQGHVVFRRRALPGFLGYTVFEADRAMLANLLDDWSAFLAESREPAGHFISAFLAPFNFDMARDVARGEQDLCEDVEEPFSPKFLYGPALRVGKLYGDKNLVGIEIRQWDFPSVGMQAPLPGRAGLLLQSAALTTGLLSSPQGFTNFARFAHAPLCKYETAMERLLLTARDSECVRACPGMDSREAWLEFFDTLGAAVSARNGKSYRHDPRLPFLQPLRAWESHPFLDVFTGPQRTAAEILVRKAVREYVLALWRSRAEPESSRLDSLRRAVAKWSLDSGLGALAVRWGTMAGR